MSMNKPTDEGRRRLLGGTLALGGAALGNALLPAVAVAGDTQEKRKSVQPAPLFDPTLENWPGYSAHIAVPRSLSAAAADEEGLDRL